MAMMRATQMPALLALLILALAALRVRADSVNCPITLEAIQTVATENDIPLSAVSAEEGECSTTTCDDIEDSETFDSSCTTPCCATVTGSATNCLNVCEPNSGTSAGPTSSAAAPASSSSSSSSAVANPECPFTTLVLEGLFDEEPDADPADFEIEEGACSASACEDIENADSSCSNPCCILISGGAGCFEACEDDSAETDTPIADAPTTTTTMTTGGDEDTGGLDGVGGAGVDDDSLSETEDEATETEAAAPTTDAARSVAGGVMAAAAALSASALLALAC